MTDKEKLEKLKKLADAMYYAAQYLTTDASSLHKAMDEYHKFIIHEYKEEQASEKKCMYSKDNYTDEDRKVLCDGCEEECRLNKKEDSVNKDLEQAIDTYIATYFGSEQEKQNWPFLKKMAIHFANWQKEKMLTKAVDAVVKIDAGGYPYVDTTIELYDYVEDIPLAKEDDKVKIVIIKEN